MAFTYTTISPENPWFQRAIFMLAFLLSGISLVFFNYIYMPKLATIWDYFGFIIMTLPPWIIYGTHELVFWLISKMKGIHYYYVFDVGYALVVMLCILYGSFSLMLYRITGVDVRVLFPLIFLPTLAVRVLNYHQKPVAEAAIGALIATFVVTMTFVIAVQLLGGVSAIPTMTGYRRDIIDTLFGIAIYGLFICMTESLPLRFNDMFAFDGYEAFKAGTVYAIITTIILFTSFTILVFGGYLDYIMSYI